MAMAKFFLYAFLMVFALMGSEVNGCGNKHNPNSKRVRRMFVFGDSYADTGNLAKAIKRPWSLPYGMTFPKKPTGRFSDGRVLTDYIGKFLRIPSPIPYKDRRFGYKLFPYGMNFALGGSGVFDTQSLQKNLSAQIDTFQQQIKEGVFSECDLRSSIALVSVAGNDYVQFAKSGGTLEGVLDYIDTVVKQLTLDLKRLGATGVKKVLVPNLHPLECTPYLTSPSHKQCDDMYSLGVGYHNTMLEAAMNDSGNTTFLYLDLNSAFMSVINQEPGARKFKNVLKPCCEEVSSEYDCGSVDENGVKMYTLCEKPANSFYWDSVHPTQAGWTAVYHFLKPYLDALVF